MLPTMRLGVRWRQILPIAVPALLTALLLGLRIDADPPPGLTASRSPFTDEGWDVLNARNLVVLGTWAPDDWALQAVNLPFSLASAASFAAFGPGLVQARLVPAAASVLTVALLAGWTRARWGALPAVVAGLAYGCATVVLGYGGTALLEPLVALLLAAGFVVLTARGGGDLGSIGAGVLLATAVATKPSALLMVSGMLGTALLSGRLRRRAALASAALASCAIGWIIAVPLAHPAAIDSARRIWAPIAWPTSLEEAWRALLDWPAESDSIVPLAWPLITGAALAVGTAWHGLAAERRREALVLLGWFVVPLLVLLFSSYRPNRYLMPALPALALLAGMGAAWAASAVRGGVARRLVGAAIVALVAGPGLIAWAGWAAERTNELARAQAAVARLVSRGETIEGELAPTLGMSSAARLVTSRPDEGINGGDLYDVGGVRWFVGRRDEGPGWAPLHRDAWAEREERYCLPLAGEIVCLYEVP